jgi:hypothetical protein
VTAESDEHSKKHYWEKITTDAGTKGEKGQATRTCPDSNWLQAGDRIERELRKMENASNVIPERN